MKIKKFLSSTLVATSLLLAFTSSVHAEECHTVYGGDEVCETGDLTIDKKVYQPAAAAYWDNIDSNQYLFKPGEEVKFSLTIKNVSDTRIDEPRVNDEIYRILQYLVFISATDNGDYRGADTDDLLKYYFSNMEPGEERTVYFTARVKAADQIPAGTICLTNRAIAYSDIDETSDSDNASFCIGNGEGQIVDYRTPDTGLNLSAILGIEAVLFIAVGLFALNKSKQARK